MSENIVMDAPTTALAKPEPQGALATKQDNSALAIKLSELWRLAGAAVAGGFAPRGLETREKAFAAMAFGDELGFPPMASLRCIAVVNGKPALYSEGILAVVQKSGKLESHEESFDGEGDNFAAICVMKRKGLPAIAIRYAVADARKAGLWGKQGPWSNSPKDMLMWKARHRAVKAAFSDLTMGVDVVEDLRDITTPESTLTSGGGNLPQSEGAAKLNGELLGGE